MIEGLLKKDTNQRFNGGDVLIHKWFDKSNDIQQTKVEKFIPNPEQVREIVEILLLPVVNLRKAIGEILVRLNRETALYIKVI